MSEADSALVALASAVDGAATEQWVYLLPRGPVYARDGRKWKADDHETIIEATRA